jgi:hypothetical protein
VPKTYSSLKGLLFTPDVLLLLAAAMKRSALLGLAHGEASTTFEPAEEEPPTKIP